MRFRHVLVAVGTCCLVWVGGLLANEPNPVGFPKEAPRGGVGVYRVWYDDGAWHLRSSTEDSGGKKGQLMVFAGSVRCDGKLTVEAKALEKVDSITPSADGKGFDFEFRTTGAVDEAVFKVAPAAKTVTFKLKIDGAKAPAYRIVVGEKAEGPSAGDFKLPAHPKK